MAGFFITGTDTDVGKTVTTAALLSLLRSSLDAVPMKPVQTGCTFNNGECSVPDIDFIINATGYSIKPQEKGLVCPYTFEHPCSPHLASQLEKKEITIDKIKRCFNELEGMHDLVLVEGAGGIMVPIYENVFMRDLMILLDLPVILVARTGLGTINHTLLSIEELKRSRLDIAGVVFCENRHSNRDYIEQDNKKIISELSGVRILGTIPYVNNLDSVLSEPGKFNAICNKALPDIVSILKEI